MCPSTRGLSYDPNGNLLSVTDARGKVTGYAPDAMDRVQTRTDPRGKPETYAYDPNGNLRTVTDRKNQPTTITYDALDRPSQFAYADGSSTTLTWDAGDRLMQVADSLSGTITRTPDSLDRLQQEVTPQGTVTYAYDNANRRASMTVLGQPAVTYGYDAADRLTSLTQGTAAVALAYDDANRRTSLTLPNGVVATYGYSTRNELTNLTFMQGSTTLGTLTYTYDAAGRRTTVGGTWARTGLPAALASATYDDANRQLTWGGQSFTYDDNGNLSGDGTNTYSWDARNRLATISGGTVASFQYDPLGRRTWKIIAGQTTDFLYDWDNPVQELSGGVVLSNLLTGLGIDEYFTRTDGSGRRTLLGDALGSILALTDDAGVVQTSYTYEPFGQTTVTGQANGNSLQYTGRENDGTGLYYYRARYYHPTLQRFVSEDPIGFAGGDVNLYAYVANDPLKWTDPLGLEVLNPKNLPVQPAVLAALHAFNQYIGLCKDIVITGGDRPGDPESHGQGLAADIKVPGQLHLLTANQAADSSLFGGVGWYEEGYYDPRDPKVGPHVHVDLRKGTFRWGHAKSGREYHGSFPRYTGPRQECPQSQAETLSRRK